MCDYLTNNRKNADEYLFGYTYGIDNEKVKKILGDINADLEQMEIKHNINLPRYYVFENELELQIVKSYIED